MYTLAHRSRRTLCSIGVWCVLLSDHMFQDDYSEKDSENGWTRRCHSRQNLSEYTVISYFIF